MRTTQKTRLDIIVARQIALDCAEGMKCKQGPEVHETETGREEKSRLTCAVAACRACENTLPL